LNNNYNIDYKILLLRTENIVKQFITWVENENFESYDLYDLMSTKFGISARKIFFKSKILGSFLVSPILMSDIVFPFFSRRNMLKHRYPTADAHFIKGYINLYNMYGKSEYLKVAERLGDELISESCKGYSGMCWGYPFDWLSSNEMWFKNTPFVTVTPYCYEAFKSLYETTNDKNYLNILKSITDFFVNDLNETRISDNSVALSYSPIDYTKVFNANAYSALIFAESYKMFRNNDFKRKAELIVNFIIQNQEKDGSWYYSIDNPHERFIDNFHTCFILKNLYKVNKILNSENIKNAIIKGYKYYYNNLFLENGEPKPFAISKKLNLLIMESYDFAEGISLGVLLSDIINYSFDKSCLLAERLFDKYKTPNGYFITRIIFPGIKLKIPYFRWAQSQTFFALTELLKKLFG
jgi:hypothetical protein